MKYGTKALDAVVEIAIPKMGIANQWRSQASAVVCRTPVVDDQNSFYSCIQSVKSRSARYACALLIGTMLGRFSDHFHLIPPVHSAPVPQSP